MTLLTAAGRCLRSLGAILPVILAAGCTWNSSAAKDPGEGGTTTIEVTVVDGDVVDDRGPVAVPLGEHVVVHIRADVDDHAHLHGYDVMEEVGPSNDATLEFDADIPGAFAVELESRHITVLELNVE